MNRRMTAIDVTEGLRTFVWDDDDECGPTPRAGSPVALSYTIIVTPPTEPLALTDSQRLRQLSCEATPTPRPKLERKAATAPPGVLHLYPGVKPQPPRRAISARTAWPGQSSGDLHRRDSVMNLSLPRLSHFGTPISRSLISRRRTTRRAVGKLGLKPRKNVWRMSPPPEKKYQLISEMLNDKKRSFSEKARVKEAMKYKNLEAIRTPFVDYKSRDLPGTPLSMAATPRELYSSSEKGTPPLRSDSKGEKPSPLRGSPNMAKHFSLPLTSDVQRRPNLKHSRSVASPPSRIETVYAPGPIRLEEKIAETPRRGSIATMELFDNGTEPKAKRFSDMVALDGIVMYFQGLGVVDESSEEGLDRFWIPDTRANRQTLSPRKPVPPVPPVPRRPSFSSLPSSSGHFPTGQGARHDEKQQPPSPSTPGRRRAGLRQLLKSSRSIL